MQIDRNDGRYKAGAKVALEKSEILDDWPKSRQNVFVKNKEVSVCVGSSDGWLCLAKLPLDFTEEQFLQLAGAYGKVKEAFTMVSEITGRLFVRFPCRIFCCQIYCCLQSFIST